MLESHDSPPYFQHLLAPTNHLIYKVMLINQVLVDSILRTNYLTPTIGLEQARASAVPSPRQTINK
jgi:hypothetical protein